jgi:hypothetical protein
LLSFFFALTHQRKSVAAGCPVEMALVGFLFCFLSLSFKEKRSSFTLADLIKKSIKYKKS